MNNHSKGATLSGRSSPDIIKGLWAEEEPKRAASPSTVDRQGEHYARLLGQRLLPRDQFENAKAALLAFARHGSIHAFSAVWDDLAQRLYQGKLEGASHLGLIQSFVDDMVGRRLGLMERNAAVVQSAGLLARDLEMANFVAATTPNVDDAERANRVACELAQRLMPTARRSVKGRTSSDGRADYFDEAVKYVYTADVATSQGPKLLREIVIPKHNNKKYLMERCTMSDAFGKIHPATGPSGELLVGKVTRLVSKGDNHTYPLTADEVTRDNAVLARVGSPLAPKDVVRVDDKVISFHKRYGGDVLTLFINLRKHTQTGAHGVNPMRNQLVTYIFKGAATAMERAHTAGVIHRDIKPDNILYHPTKPATLSGYALAYVRHGVINSGPSTEIQCFYDGIKGSKGYIAPEIVNGSPGMIYTQQVDVFSLGASLAYMTAYDLQDLPFYNVNLPHDTDTQHGMHTAARIYESWRSRRAPSGNIDGPIDWNLVRNGKEPLDRQGRSMLKLGEPFANMVLDMLLPDPRLRAKWWEVPRFAQSLARAAHLDWEALAQVMTDSQKYNRRARTAEVAIGHHAAIRLSISELKDRDSDLRRAYPEDNVWQPNRTEIDEPSEEQIAAVMGRLNLGTPQA